jgi:2-hydroxychromene-2-carboxylate isomerase
MAEPITFYFDPLSPFAYIGSVVIERVAAKHGRDVVWHPVLLGVTVLKIMGMRPLLDYPLKGAYLRHDIERLSAWFDVPLRPHGLAGVNSLAACRAYLWAQDHAPAVAKPLAQALFARLWQRGEDITDVEAVVAEAAHLGIDPDTLRTALATPGVKQRLQQAVQAAVDAGVFGVPTFLADGELFWGNDHVWMLEHWLQHHRFTP